MNDLKKAVMAMMFLGTVSFAQAMEITGAKSPEGGSLPQVKSLHSMRDMLSSSMFLGSELDVTTLSQDQKNYELLSACAASDKNTAGDLLEAGAHINCVDEHSWTPLH